MDLSEIYAPVKNELSLFEASLKAVGTGDAPWLHEPLAHALKGGGKRLRPALVFLSSSFYDFNLARIMPIALAVELMHLATLVHDDTIDNSFERWGRPTINKIWGMEKAVLLGDYLFAQAGEFTARTENIRVIKLLPQTLMIITNGELAQAANTYKINISREQYIFRVTSKTAALFIMATESGAVLGKAPEASIHAMHDYGLNMGIAFQIIDDILDFISTEEEMGKPVGSDLLQGNATLPAMMLIERYPADNPIKKLFEDKNADRIKLVAQTIDMVRNSTIIQECYDIVTDYSHKACDSLKKLPAKPAKESLIKLGDFIVSRRR
ncbi:MAG TPA: polyprenyl synthetase family protein [Dehalococcoidales bacterium]|nr:polyprenyl synthetase family protein [Dehalococcoidales bacterium]